MTTLFQQVDERHKLASVLAAVEARSAIRRRQFAGDILFDHGEAAVSLLEAEVTRMTQYLLTPAVLQLAGELVDRRNLRALDSVQLSTAVLARGLVGKTEEFKFVGSDQKLLRSAEAEGLEVWDPTVKGAS